MNTQLLRFNRKQKYIIFDTETEGLNLIKSKPWQAAWIVAEGNKVIKKYDKLIKWDDLKVSKDAARITGFSKSYYEKNAEDPKKVWDEFSKYLYDDDYLIVGQNLLGFDVYMVDVWRKLIGEPLLQDYINRIIDTRSLGVSISRNIPLNKDNFLSWQYKMLEIKTKRGENSMGTLLKKYNIPHDPKKLHDALYDINMNYKVFRKQLYEVEL